ncbi:MAG TPA: adenylate/guanylate cyclase domain-containing protein, partial [Candidatus Dormibacteraeota bacterium]|nr:adenylate/guanylate cyclase domain-containing protein [Candidatus Dormibacteraeota bacterium]
MSACSNCGASLPESARFCPACGSTLAAVSGAADERKIVTILFADVTGSTGLGERLDAEQVKEVMSAFFAAMRDEIEAQGGTVEKFIGDAVMAAFGVPIAHEDDRLRALRTALNMRRRLEAVNAELHASHRVALEMRVGINTGEVVASRSPQAGEGMVAGDAVNVAARLEQVAAPGQIVVAERTAKSLLGFGFRTLGRLALKGKGQTVAALELLDEQAGEQRGIPGLRAPIVGRDSEMAVLEALYARAAEERRPQLVTVYGEAGVGKSRLVAEFLDRADTRSPLVLRGRCLPYGDGITYWPLGEILKSYAEVLDSDPPTVALDKIAAVTKHLFATAGIADAERASAALAYTVGLEHPNHSFR